MKKVFLCILTMFVLLGSVACARPAVSEIIQSEKLRVTSPAVNEANLATLADGNSAFAFDLYQALKEADENI